MTYEEWLKTRPASVRKLAAEFPKGTTFRLDGVTMYLVGYTEGDSLLVSPIDPEVDYGGALDARRRICAPHLRK